MASQPQFTNTGGRRADRKSFKAEVQFRKGTSKAQVEVHDISRFGARIAGVFLVREGDRFWIRLPRLEPIEALVKWSEDFQFGCEFAQPLNEAVFDAIVRTT